MKWLFLLMPTIFVFSQSTSTRWQDHFSYNNIKHIWEINGLIFCSAENGIFSYDPVSGEIQKISKTTQLNDVGITAFNYNPDNEIIFIGYESGELDILTPDGNRNLLQVPLHQGYTGSKIINHITTHQNTAIISGEWGIVTFSLEDFEFMETTYFIIGGNYFGVKESVVMDGIIYSAGNGGIHTHALDGFTANFTSWQQPQGIPNSPYQDIVAFNGNIIANTWGNTYRFDGNSWMFMGNYPSLRDININGNVLTISELNSAYNFDNNLNLTETVSFTQDLNTAAKIGNVTYGGSKQEGLIAGLNNIIPDGPYNNKSWSVTAFDKQIWVAPGGVNDFSQPQFNFDGYYHFDGISWKQIKSQSMLNAKDIVHIEVNTKNPSEVYVSSWMEFPDWNPLSANTHIGMFKMVDDVMVNHYNSENSGLKFKERIAGSKLDEQGNLWVAQGFVNDQTMGLAKKDANGAWSYIGLGGKTGAMRPIVYNGFAFVPSPRAAGGGVFISDMSSVYSITSSASNGKLPTDYVVCVAIEQNGTLWIGTELGLRILYNPIETVQSGSFETQPIIIEQNGIPEALLMDTQINDIEVDGANRKWIATETSGVFYVSENGEETIFNFTSGNSPLPSNKVNDINVDPTTGVVYFATDKGIVSYRSDAVDVGESFGDVYSYPNPVRPGFNGNVVIKGLPNDADVRIVDVVGNLIYNTKAAGGIAQWDTKNLKGKPVASGIYLVLMTNRDASETKQTKIAIVR
ncbi:Por secretion system C-terminal sorting domain-containing protein [Moheibacter sediminis]|uniref:Por secretion system C-terminal sorting domain-containing protein n=2 Tax=Moheibacter sediminis TaxID=1434700 RepID=A0A1W1Y7L2_9FLAO|nr:Por secretion system C-terminal sorting domain-containing protein [Moheibacter sediminis]